MTDQIIFQIFFTYFSIAGWRPMTTLQGIQHDSLQIKTYINLYKFKTKYYAAFEKKMTGKNVTG